MSIGQIFLGKLGFLVKIFITKKIILICNKVYKDLKANKTNKHQLTIKASDANELFCDNNIGKTHHVNRSYSLKKTWLFRQYL